MAKFLEKVDVQDRTIPVQANLKKPGGAMEARLFPNDGEKLPMDQFDAWYDPKVYHYVGQIEDGSLTMINLEHVQVVQTRAAKPESAAVRKRAAAEVARREKQERKDAREKKRRESGGAAPVKKGERAPRGGGDGVSGSIAVEAAGKAYGTLMTAFKKLGLNMAERKDFRKELIKADGKEVTYSRHGKKVVFRWLKDGKPAKEESKKTPLEVAVESSETGKKLGQKKASAKEAAKPAKKKGGLPSVAEVVATATRLERSGHVAKKPAAKKKAAAKKKGGKK